MESGEITPAPTSDERGRRGGTVHVAGTGSYAAEIAEFAKAAGFQVHGLIELIDPARVGTTIHGLPVVDARVPPHAGARAVVAAGANRVRLWEALATDGWTAATVVHPWACVSPSAEIAEGCIAGPAVVIGARSALAAQALLGRGCLIGHHVSIGAGAVVNPGANVAGNVSVGRGATVGIGAIVVNGVSIGERATVAAGAVVMRDVPAGVRVQGVPAREYNEARSGR